MRSYWRGSYYFISLDVCTKWVIVNDRSKPYGENEKTPFFQIFKFLAFCRRLGGKCIKISKIWAKKMPIFSPKIWKIQFLPAEIVKKIKSFIILVFPKNLPKINIIHIFSSKYLEISKKCWIFLQLFWKKCLLFSNHGKNIKLRFEFLGLKKHVFVQMWAKTKIIKDLIFVQILRVQIVFSKFWQKHVHFLAHFFRSFYAFFPQPTAQS